jgi:predicted dehydrogenase
VSVLGAGAMGRLHARVLAGLGDAWTLCGVYDPRPEAAREVAAAWGVTPFDSEPAAIAAASVVVVASPIEAHAATARRAIEQGKHLLVEKPVCETSQQAYALAGLVGRDQRVFVGHSERFNPVVQALARLVAPGAVESVRLRRTATRATSRPRPEHGVLVSLGVHDLDLVAHLTGSTVSLRDALHVDDDRADLVLETAGGAVARVQVDRRAAQRERMLELETRDATYRGDLLARTLSVRRRGAAAFSPCQVHDTEALVAQAVAVRTALLGLEGLDGPTATLLDGARALTLVEEALAWRASPARVASGAS